MGDVVTLSIEATDGAARAGVLSTPHGVVTTPAFMPVATQASVKALTSDEVGAVGAENGASQHVSPAAASGA